MTTKRRKFTNIFKAMVALAAIREQKNTSVAVEGIRDKPQPDITVEAGVYKEHGEGVRR